ncbi:outer membrane lipoprotein carrier protein LolA [Streptomyces pactum]|uniref:Outer membrane lipoprotein carrier protein LolA n=1 Tax=Streptomyces pactum TaxID=68249 RepID=A0ABS0NJV0_9ACTN|nr:sigma-E factor regulatory protein RseB domain-containing protein [Streptomyces pactum]MBH5335475.1 outer membrane lipoprotein carrier protein LolA [Streptomyces pactum]
MARIRPTQVADDAWDDESPVRRRKGFRYAVPVAAAGVAAATIGLVPALANSGDPDLPKISAEELISKIAAADVQQASGTVKITTDLGLPGLPEGLSLGGDDGAASASPESKLPELASGTHTLRFAVDGPDRQRVSIIEDAAEYSVIHNGQEVWAYDSGSNTAFHATAPKDAAAKGEKGQPELPADLRDATPQELAERALAAVDENTEVRVDGTAKVAGRDAYQLKIVPKQDDSTIGSVRIAVDAEKGVPLKFTLTPKSGGKAVVEAGFTKIDFGKPSASRFEFTPPKGTKVTEQGDLEREAAKLDERLDGTGLKGVKPAEELSGLKLIGESWNSVVQFEIPGGLPGGGSASSDAEGAAADLLDSLGDKVKGDFGSGTVFSTRLVNALLTDDGKVFVGAVDKDALIKAADAAK